MLRRAAPLERGDVTVRESLLLQRGDFRRCRFSRVNCPAVLSGGAAFTVTAAVFDGKTKLSKNTGVVKFNSTRGIGLRKYVYL